MKWWPQARAGAIALVIALGLIDGCPIPPEPKVLPWQRQIVDVVRPVQRVLLRPFAWVTRVLRFSQRWALFQGAGGLRFRLEVLGKRDGQWTLLFRAGDPDHDEYADLLLDERVRGAWNPVTDRAMQQFGPFSDWFLAHVLADHPELNAAKLWMERVTVEDGELHPTGNYVMPMERTR